MFDQLKTQFPQDEAVCYLNHAAVSPWPKKTTDAVCAFAQENLIRGAQLYPNWLKTEADVRHQLKTLINAESTDEIALAKNTSEALSIIAYGLDWNQGDEVIISDQEFPSNRIVWESLSKFGVNTIAAPLGSTHPEDAIIECVTDNTRIVSISSVQYASGLTLNLEYLAKKCREKGVLLCVDAIQSLGAIPFDQQKIQADFIVADGHKWLMASEGLALMYIKRCHIEKLKLHQFGWHMVEEKGNYDKQSWAPAKNATRFECGSPNMLGIHAMHASLEFILDIGIEHIHQALQKKVHHLIALLREIPSLSFLSNTQNPQSGIICFTIEGQNMPEVQQSLMKQGVICAYRGGGIRFSPHFYTPDETLGKAVTILKTLLS